MMPITAKYDSEVNALYVKVGDAEYEGPLTTKPAIGNRFDPSAVNESVLIDYDEGGEVYGYEFLLTEPLEVSVIA